MTVIYSLIDCSVMVTIDIRTVAYDKLKCMNKPLLTSQPDTLHSAFRMAAAQHV